MPADQAAPFIYMVQMDIPAEHEAEFNRVYDEQHVPDLLSVPGVRAARRYVVEHQQGRHGAILGAVRTGLRRGGGQRGLA